jgi:hypothetical protein
MTLIVAGGSTQLRGAERSAGGRDDQAKDDDAGQPRRATSGLLRQAQWEHSNFTLRRGLAIVNSSQLPISAQPMSEDCNG